MVKTLRRILYAVYLLTVIPLLACYLSQFISPAVFWPLAFFGLLFPVLIIVQIIFAVIFLLMRSKAVVIPVVMILAGWNPIGHTFQLHKGNHAIAAGQPTVRVMTYNVRLFDIAHYWSGKKDQSEGIFSYITEIKPDILCFQEFALQDPGKFSLDYIKTQLPFLPHSAVEFNFTTPTRKHGLAIFSKYPIIQTGHEHFQDTKNMMLYADILVMDDTIRVYNNHLESIHFDRDELQWIDTTTNKTRIPRDKVTEIIDRMKSAYIKRAAQADLVRKSIDLARPGVIVCGDFNDTPVSYATRKIGRNLFDSFRSGGLWLGITFPNVRAPLRIDYILHSRKMVSTGYQIGRVKYSDHRPVSCDIGI